MTAGKQSTTSPASEWASSISQAVENTRQNIDDINTIQLDKEIDYPSPKTQKLYKSIVHTISIHQKILTLSI